MNAALPLSTVLLSVAALGCSTFQTFRADGFHHEEYPLTVRSPPGAPTGALISPEWRLDNYQVDEIGLPTKPKVGPDYEAKIAVDTDGDGKLDQDVQVLAHDLLFRHRRNAGRIWLRALPISQALGETDLRVIMRAFEDAMAGAGYSVTSLDFGRVNVEEKRFAARLLESAPTTVSGQEAFAATFEVANVDQMALTKDARTERGRIVLVRTSYLWSPYKVDWSPERALFPVLVVAGYSNLPEDFEVGRADFERFLGALAIWSGWDGVRGTVLQCFPGRASVPIGVGLDGSGAIVHLHAPAQATAEQIGCTESAMKAAPPVPGGLARLAYSFGREVRAPASAPASPSPVPAAGETAPVTGAEPEPRATEGAAPAMPAPAPPAPAAAP